MKRLALGICAALLLAVASQADTSTANHFPTFTTISEGRSPSIGSSGGTLVAMWRSLPFVSRLQTSRSTDGGTTWSTPVEIGGTENTGGPGKLSGNGSGVWISSGDVRSVDDGQTWSVLPVPVPGNAVYAGGGAWVSVASAGPATLPGTQVVTQRSTDNGETWSPPVTLDTSSTLVEGMDLASDGAGNVVIAWSRCNAGCVQPAKVVSRSSNGGISWSLPVTVTTEGTSQGTLNLETDSSGVWMLAWRKTFNGGPREIYASKSLDNGATWGVPVLVARQASLRLLDFATNGSGTWFLGLEYLSPTGPDVPRHRRSTDDGATWSPPTEGPLVGTIASSGDSFNVVYQFSTLPPPGDDFVRHYSCDIAANVDCDEYPDVTDLCPYLNGDAQPADTDGDSHGDTCDTCPATPNPGQEDADLDLRGDICDNCPAWANPTQALPQWPVAANDPDCDNFTTASELFLGTHPQVQCAYTTGPGNDGPPDMWPTDPNDDRITNTVDVGFLVPVLGSSSPGPPYKVRFDFNGNGIINTVDVGRFVPLLGKPCS